MWHKVQSLNSSRWLWKQEWTSSYYTRIPWLVDVRLRLCPIHQTPEETLGAFYIRNCYTLHNDIQKVQQIVALLATTKGKYTEFVSILRDIREFNHISQEEMAKLLGTAQSTISKFESAASDVSLEFLISYANVFGCGIKIDKVSEILSRHKRKQLQRVTGTLQNDIVYSKKRIRDELLYAKHMLNGNRLTIFQVYIDCLNKYQRDMSDMFPEDSMTEMTIEYISQRLGVSERTVRRFENDDDFASPAQFIFKYAELMNMELRLDSGTESFWEYIVYR